MKIAILLGLALAVGANAEVYRYTFKGVFTSSEVPAAVAVGDRYTLTFNLDYAAVDDNAALQDGAFIAAVSKLTFALDVGAVGNYTGGSMTGAQFLQLTDNFFGSDHINFYTGPNWLTGGLTFPGVGGDAFTEIGFDLYSNSTNTFNIPSAQGETLGSVLHGPLVLSSFDNLTDVHLVFGDFTKRAWASVESIAAVVVSQAAFTSANHATFASGVANAFTLTATGAPAPTFSVIGGALPSWATLNGTTGVISGTPPNNAGSPFVFTLQASNSVGTVTQEFTLTVQPLGPAITTQPQNQLALAGQNATFSVTVSGNGPLTYQWRRNGFAIAGGTSASLLLPTVSRTDADYYDVVVADSIGAVSSQIARLSVAPTAYPTLVTSDPAWDIRPEKTGGTGYAIVPLSDGRAYLAGEFTSIDGIRRTGLARVKADGTLDATFVPPEIDNRVLALAVLSDGRIVIGGDFVRVGGVGCNHLARLNSDGSLDAAFSAGGGASATVNALAVQLDGRILVGGAFYTFNGASVSHLVRLNPDGSLDTGYNPILSNSVLALAVQSDGRILVGGSFRNVNGANTNGFVRLGLDGTLDTTFGGSASLNGDVAAIIIQADGRVLVGGVFTTFGSTPLGCIARFNVEGSLDTAFATAAGTGFGFAVKAIATQPDGRILVGGTFASFNGTVANRFTRLNSDGTRDTGFQTLGLGGSVFAVAVQSGKPVVGGRFNTYIEASNSSASRSLFARLNVDGSLDPGVNLAMRTAGSINTTLLLPGGKALVTGLFTTLRGVDVPASVARLNADGSVDNTFNTGGSGADSDVLAAARQPDGKIFITGFFTSYNGGTAPGIARLNSDGTRDAGFNPPGGLSGGFALAVRPGGSVVVGGGFANVNGVSRHGIAALNPDGSLDTSFDPGAGAKPVVYCLALQPDQKIVVGGAFSSFNGFAAGSLVRLNANGSLDTSFSAGSGAGGFGVNAVALLSGGKMLVGGPFEGFNGVARRGIVRLNADGTLDNGFVPPPIGDSSGMLPQEDGRVVVRHSFGSVSGAAGTAYLVRLNGDGSRDSTFAAAGFSPKTDRVSLAGLNMRDDGKMFFTGSGTAAFAATQSATLPTVIAPPQMQTVTANGAVSFTVAGASALPLTYQWRFNGIVIPGATGATLSLANVQAVNAGSYSVVVTNELGSVTSAVATLAVQPLPTITRQPVSKAVGVDTGVTFTVSGSGTGALTYRWKKDDVNLVDDGRITGTTSPTLSIAAVTLADAGAYSVVVSNADGGVPSDFADLAVIDVRPTHGVAGFGYAPGGRVTVTNTITYTGTLSVLGWSVLLPPGWSYVVGGGSQGPVRPDPGTTGLLEWAWITVPDSPTTFTYTLNVPAGTNGPQTLSALVLTWQASSPHFQILAKPDPLIVEQITHHSADTNHDFKLSLTELLRVIELYNARNGTVRTGAYSVDPTNSEDGFMADPVRLGTAVVTLTKYHFADTNRDGKLALTELLRVIELYNHRTGTVRDGLYHVDSTNAEDGFATGP